MPTPTPRTPVERWRAWGWASRPTSRLDYATALASLKQARDKLPKLADYTGYFLAATRVELQDTAGIAEDLAPARSRRRAFPAGGEILAAGIPRAQDHRSRRGHPHPARTLPRPAAARGRSAHGRLLPGRQRPAASRRILPARLLPVPHRRRCQPGRRRAGRAAGCHGRGLSAALAATDAAPRRQADWRFANTPRRGPSTPARWRRSRAWKANRRACASARRTISKARPRRPPPTCEAWNWPSPRRTPSAGITWRNARATWATMKP